MDKKSQEKCLIPDDQYVAKKRSLTWERMFIFFCLLMFTISTFVIFHRPILEYFSPDGYAPEQVHLSLGSENGEYYVTWMTQEPAECSLVWTKLLPDGEPESRQEMGLQWVKPNKFESTELERPSSIRSTSYRAKMVVEPGQKYRYDVGCRRKGVVQFTATEALMLRSVRLLGAFKSRPFEFYATDYRREKLNVLFYGDLGLKNGQSVPRLIQEAQSNSTNLIIHNGDFAYDLDTDHGRYGDEFMRLIEPIASIVPYQTAVGNHEVGGNFSHYNYRFTMVNRAPNGQESMNNFYYSYNRGPIHFVAFSTEFYYFLEYAGVEPLVSQYNWLKEDLARASSPEERAQRPWIIVYGHRPMYCSSRDHDDCSKDSNILRKGLPFTNGAFALEKLFYEFGVDVEIYAHEHQYERFLPLFNGKVFNGSQDEPYTNPRAPVHIISGSAGCQEKLDPFKGKAAPGSVIRISDYGYSRLRVVSSCELKFEQISDDQSGDIVDSFTLRKDRQNFPDSMSSISYTNCS